jgi:Xaa-Pro aminopeptidase
VLSELRSVKDDEEIRRIRKAISVAQRAFRELIAKAPRALIGRSERDAAAELDYRMRQLGASEAAFETVVAAGAHSSLPHYRPGSAPIRRDQVVLFDWGAKVDGYCSDLTRTVFVGRIPPKLARIYEVVLRAQQAGIAAVRSGAECRAVDAAARKVIEAAGFGEQFMHGLGHGIGRAVHEGPALAQLSASRLRSRMVVTVEPGIYIPGVGGVRIEDDILVTPQGAKRLSSLGRTLDAVHLM